MSEIGILQQLQLTLYSPSNKSPTPPSVPCTFFHDPGSSLAGILAHMNVAEVIPE
jgi:hypothetical protein